MPERRTAGGDRLLPWAGGSARKVHRDGTHRTVAPAVTVERVRAHSAAMGITRVGDVTGLDRIGIPVVMVTRPNARSLAVNQGKGLTLDAARASGVMEAAETHHAEHALLPLRLATETELRRRHAVVDTGALARPADSPYHPDRTLLWSEGFDLLAQASVQVPYEVVHTRFTTTPLPGAGCFLASSNGLASGNHPLEAVAHGLYEVIERDATVLWSLRGPAEQDATRLDLDTVGDPGCRWVLDRYEAAAVDVAVWDQTLDIGLPCFACEIVDREEHELDATPAAAGMGCHPARAVALLRALTEAAQSRLTAIAGSRDDQLRSAYARSGDLDELRAHRAALAAQPGVRSFRDVPDLAADTVDADVEETLGRLRKAGLEQAVVVDLRLDGIGLDVARVVVPGLEHWDDHAEEFLPGTRARAVIER